MGLIRDVRESRLILKELRNDTKSVNELSRQETCSALN